MPSEKGVSRQQGFFSSFYLAIEDLYYGTADWLEERGVKAYEWFIEPIEKSGIPSFPIAVLLLLGIVFGAYYLYSNPNLFGPSSSIQVSVLAEGKPVSDAVVELRVEGEKPLQRITSLDGSVVFDGIPSGKRATLKVLKEGFESYSKSLVTGGEGKIGAELRTEEQPIPAPVPRVTVIFQDLDTKKPVGGVRVTYQGPQVGVKEVFTNDDGSAYLEFGEGQVRILVYSPYYGPISDSVKTSDEGKVFYLKSVSRPTPSATPGPGDGDCTSASCSQPLEGVSVSVVDEDGQLVDARVELNFIGTFTSPKTAFGTNGIASFPRAGAVGTRVFAKAYPTDSGKYAEGESDSATIIQGGLDLVVRVKRKSDISADATKVLAIEVRDERDNAVPGANVHLFLAANTDPIVTKLSGDDGKVSVEVANGQPFTAVVWKEGFLPSDKYFIAPDKRSQKIILKKLVIGGYANVNVTVRDEDGAGVTGASVNLRYAQDNLPLGIPASQTDETASFLFVGVPANVLLKAVASSGAFKGESAGFRGQAGVENRAVVTLERPTGRIAVLVRDPFTDQKISGALITAVDRNKKTSFRCTTDANGACAIQSVPASTPIDVTATAAGYLNSTLRGFIVVAGETLSIQFKEGLTPIYLANETRLKVGLYGSSCADGPLAPGTALAKARAYCVRLDFNIPNASDPTGFFFRLNREGDAGRDMASIIGIQDNDDLALPLERLAIKKAQKYANGVSCDTASSEQSQEWKWVNYEFNGVQGSKTVFLRIFVRANSSAGSRLDFNYFSYAVKEGKYFRIPFDTAMGISRVGGGKDYCEAETNTTTYRIADGNVFYNSNGGLSLGFEASPASATLNTQAGNTFLIRFTTEYFKPLSAPAIKISSTDPQGTVRKFVKFNSYALSSGGVIVPETPLNGNSEETISFNPTAVQNVGGAFQLNGTINATALLPVSLAKIKLELLESGLTLVNLSATATITGKAKPTIQLIPDGVPLDANADNTLTVSVTTGGVPVTDTIVYIASLAGFSNPFGATFADGDIQVAGDGSEGKGKNGRYVFRLRPTQSGKFAVVVGGARDVRFEETTREVEVRQNNFIQPFPSSLALGCAADRLELRNTLSTASALVNISFSQSNACVDLQGAGVRCIQQTQFGCSKWQLTLAENEAKVLGVIPKRTGACTLAISSSINPLTVSFSTIDASVSCTTLQSQCSLSASPDSVFGGENQQRLNQTNLTASFRNPPLEFPLFAEFNCGEGQAQVAAVFVQPNGIDALASTRCQYSEVGAITSRNAKVKLLNSQQLPASPEISCAKDVLVAPKPGGAASCVLSSIPAPGSFTARLRATYFNLLPTTTKAVFVCDERNPASAFGDAPLIYNPSTRTHSAEFECDYAGMDGSVFNASTAAGTAFCANESTRIIPPGPGCTLGSGSSAERMQFGQCSRNAPPLICGGTSSSPSLQPDLTGTCCREVLGSDFVLDSSGAVPYCKKVQLPAPNTCGDGVTLADSCRTIMVDGKVRPTTLYCDATRNFVGNASCCLAVPGFEFDSATGQCRPVDVSACTITSGSISQRVSYGNCTAAPVGLRCGGAPTTPVLQGDTSCCQAALGGNYVWSEGNRSCVNPSQPFGPNNCDANTAVGECQQPDPNNANWIPGPQSCFNVGSGPQWFYGRSECCSAYADKEYQMSDDGRVCVEVPAALITPSCTAVESSLVLSPDGRTYNAQFNATARRLNNFFNGNVEFVYSCDDGIQPLQSSMQDIGVSVERRHDFPCSYPRGFFNTSVKPKARAIITSPVTGQQKTVECNLVGPDVNPNKEIILRGSSGQQPTFEVFATISNLNFSQIVPAPLGPLSGIKMTVRITNMPPGLAPANLALYLECDSGLQKVPMGFDQLALTDWVRLCSYSSPQSNRNWPAVHKPRAFYQVTVGDVVFPLAGVPPAFPDINEYAQPVAAGIEITRTLNSPTLRDQNLSVELTARFRKLPRGLNNLHFTCEGENFFQLFTPNVGADGTANASKVCNYTSNAVAISEYRFTIAQDVLADSLVSSQLGIDYRPAQQAAFCDWQALPREIVVGNASGDRFSPSVIVTGITAMPRSVEFDCGNGQRLPATSVVQTAQRGQEIEVLASTTATCRYDFSFLAGESSKVIQLNAFVNGGECGPKTLTANSFALGSTRALLSQPEIVDDEGLGRQAKVNITVVSPPENFEQLNPVAVFDCGRGTETAGVRQEVLMEKRIIQPTPIPTPSPTSNATVSPTATATATPSPSPTIAPSTIFFAEAICSYNAVFNNTLRTIKGEVRARPPYGRLVTIPPQVTFVQRAPNVTATNYSNATAEFGINEEFRKCGGFGLFAALAPLLAQSPDEQQEEPFENTIYPPEDYNGDADQALLKAAAEAFIGESVRRGEAFAVILDSQGTLRFQPRSRPPYIIKYALGLVSAATKGIVVYYAASDIYQKGNENAPSITLTLTAPDGSAKQDCLEVRSFTNPNLVHTGPIEVEHGSTVAFAVATRDGTKCTQQQYAFTLTAQPGQPGAGGQAGGATAQVIVKLEKFDSGIEDLYCPMFSPKTATSVVYRVEGKKPTPTSGPNAGVAQDPRQDRVVINGALRVSAQNRKEPGGVDPTQYANNLRDASEVRPHARFFLTALPGSDEAAAVAASNRTHGPAPGIFGTSPLEPHRPVFLHGRYGRFGAQPGTTITVVAPAGGVSDTPTLGPGLAQCTTVQTTGLNSWTWSSGDVKVCPEGAKNCEWESYALGPLEDYDVIGNKLGGSGGGSYEVVTAPSGPSITYLCSGKDFCSRDQENAVKTEITGRINEALRNYSTNVQALVPQAAVTNAIGPAAFGRIQAAMDRIKKRIAAQDIANQQEIQQQVQAQQAQIQALNQQGAQGGLGPFGPGQNGIPPIPPGGFPPFGGPEFQGGNRTKVIDGCIGVAACAAIMSQIFNSLATKNKKNMEGMGGGKFNIGKFLRLFAIPFCASEGVQKALASNSQGAFGSAFLGSPLAPGFAGLLNDQPPPPPTPGVAPIVTPIPLPEVGEIPPIRIDPNLYTRVAASVINGEDLKILLPIRSEPPQGESSLRVLEFKPRISTDNIASSVLTARDLRAFSQEVVGANDPRQIFSLIKNPIGYPYTKSPSIKHTVLYTDGGAKYGADFDKGATIFWTIGKRIASEEATRLKNNVKCVLNWKEPDSNGRITGSGSLQFYPENRPQPGCDLTKIREKIEVESETGCKPKRGCLFLYIDQDQKTLVTGIVKAKKQRALTDEEQHAPVDNYQGLATGRIYRRSTTPPIIHRIEEPDLAKVENNPRWPEEFVDEPEAAEPLYSDSDKFKQQFAGGTEGITLVAAGKDAAKFFLAEEHRPNELMKIDTCLAPFTPGGDYGRASADAGTIKDEDRCKPSRTETQQVKNREKDREQRGTNAPAAAEEKCFVKAKVDPDRDGADQKIFIACTARMFELQQTQ